MWHTHTSVKNLKFQSKMMWILWYKKTNFLATNGKVKVTVQHKHMCIVCHRGTLVYKFSDFYDRWFTCYLHKTEIANNLHFMLLPYIIEQVWLLQYTYVTLPSVCISIWNQIGTHQYQNIQLWHLSHIILDVCQKYIWLAHWKCEKNYDVPLVQWVINNSCGIN